jgi:hypothetical protein
MVFIALYQPAGPESFHTGIDGRKLCSPYSRLLYLVQPIDCNVRLSNIKTLLFDSVLSMLHSKCYLSLLMVLPRGISRKKIMAFGFKN